MELTKKQIQNFRRTISKENSVFLEKRLLDSLFLPSKIIGRSEQAKQLLRHIESLRQGFMVPAISVYGRSGSGKSTVVKFVCENLDDAISFRFVNLRKSKTIFGCANLVLSEMSSNPVKSSEGLNKAIETIGEKIEDILRDEKKKFFVLILDEYDVIFSDKRGSPSDFMYKLMTLEENLREKDLWLCIITISNNALIDYDLDDRVKSRMGNSEVFFSPYVVSDIRSILEDRSKKAFVKKPGIDVLEYCSKYCSDSYGDARRALDLLRLAGEMSDGKKITKADVDKANEQLQKDRITQIVSSVSYHQRVLIASICSNVINSKNGTTTTSSSYQKYKNFLSKDVKPLSYRRITDLLVELEDTGLVVSKNVSKGRYGYSTKYKLTMPPELVGPLIGKDWWEAVLAQKKSIEELNELAKRRTSLYRMPRMPKSLLNMFKSEA